MLGAIGLANGVSIFKLLRCIKEELLIVLGTSSAQQLGILAVLLLTSKGAAGVTGSGFIVLAATLSAVGTMFTVLDEEEDDQHLQHERQERERVALARAPRHAARRRPPYHQAETAPLRGRDADVTGVTPAGSLGCILVRSARSHRFWVLP